jgi:hypothetical protein
LDEAGERYAKEIYQSLTPRGCLVGRWNPKEAK